MLLVYAQGMTGKRWQLYAPWVRFLPSWVLERWSPRWSARLLWQGEISCGDKTIRLHIYGGPVSASTWWQDLVSGPSRRLVVSTNLSPVSSGRALAPGRLLLAIYLRQAIVQLSERLPLASDRLTVGLVARGQELACWLANVEGVARQVTVISDPRSRLLPLTPSGLVVRQLNLSITTPGVDVLIVAPEYLSWLEGRRLTAGTVVMRTDGRAMLLPDGVWGLGLDYGSLSFPAAFLASTDDIMPLKEAMLLAAYYSDSKTVWPSQWSKRLALMQQAVRRSNWELRWRLLAHRPLSAN